MAQEKAPRPALLHMEPIPKDDRVLNPGTVWQNGTLRTLTGFMDPTRGSHGCRLSIGDTADYLSELPPLTGTSVVIHALQVT